MRLRARWTVLGLAGAAILAVPVAGLADQDFTDVPADGTHAEGIGFLVDAGITQGCDEDRFCPDQPLTRGQMGTFLLRATGWDPEVGPITNAYTTTLVGSELLFSDFEDVELSGGEVTECVQALSFPGVPMNQIVVSHHLTSMPSGAPSTVNLAVDADRDDADGMYDLCFTRVDGEPLEAGVYETSYHASLLIGGVGAASDAAAAEADTTGVDLETAVAAVEAKRNG